MSILKWDTFVNECGCVELQKFSESTAKFFKEEGDNPTFFGPRWNYTAAVAQPIPNTEYPRYSYIKNLLKFTVSVKLGVSQVYKIYNFESIPS